MVKVIIARKARKDLDTIREYISRDNPKRAESFARELLESSLEVISQHPLSCPIWNQQKNIRKYVYQRYNVHYQYHPQSNTATIAHILNSALLKNITLKR